MKPLAMNGSFTDPINRARDGYENRIPNTRSGIDEHRTRIAQQLEHERMLAVIRRCDESVVEA